MATTEEVPVPAQWTPQPVYDFRGGADGPRGYKVGISKKGHVGTKRKLDEYSQQVEREEAEAAMRDTEPAPVVATAKRVKQNTLGVGLASGRPWKQPAQRASSLRNPGLSSSWEKKMKDKAEKQAYLSRKREAQEASKEAKRAERERRSEVKRRKEENRAKSVVTTAVSSATARRMAKNKKLHKKLVMVGDDGKPTKVPTGTARK